MRFQVISDDSWMASYDTREEAEAHVHRLHAKGWGGFVREDVEGERPLNHPEERRARLAHARRIAAEIETWDARKHRMTYRQDAVQWGK